MCDLFASYQWLLYIYPYTYKYMPLTFDHIWSIPHTATFMVKKNSFYDFQSDGCITNKIPTSHLFRHPYEADSVTLKMETGCQSLLTVIFNK